MQYLQSTVIIADAKTATLLAFGKTALKCAAEKVNAGNQRILQMAMMVKLDTVLILLLLVLSRNSSARWLLQRVVFQLSFMNEMPRWQPCCFEAHTSTNRAAMLLCEVVDHYWLVFISDVQPTKNTYFKDGKPGGDLIRLSVVKKDPFIHIEAERLFLLLFFFLCLSIYTYTYGKRQTDKQRVRNIGRE